MNFATGNVETIGQLRFINNANVTLSSPTNGNQPSTLAIAGGAAAAGSNDLFVEAGSTMNITYSGNTTNRYLLMSIGTGKKGLVAGAASINSGTIPSQLSVADAGGLVFTGTGTFTAESLLGNPFGTTPGSVIFNSGTTFNQRGGNDPFVTSTNPVTSFQDGSFYTYSGGAFSPTGQKYGNLQFLASPAAVAGTTNLTVLNNLTVGSSVITGVTVPLNVVGTSPSDGTAIGGNVTVFSGNTLAFTPATASSVTLNGSASQTISGAGAITFGSGALFEINNAQGVTQELPFSVTRGLALTQGLLTTSASGLLTLAAGASLTGGSVNSFVNGPLARVGNTSPSPVVVFPIGKVAGGTRIYRPLTLTLTTQTGSITYTAEQLEAAPVQTVATPLTRVSFRRSFSLVPSTTPTGAYSATVTLSFGADDFVNYPGDPSFVMARRDGATPWASIGRSNNSGTANGGSPVAGTLISAPFTTFPITATGFALSSSSPTTINSFPGLNPLPVSLSRFDATASAKDVAVTWATASEKNSDLFEVQRSATGEAFQTVGTVKGQGTTTSAHAYSFVDSRPLAGRSYYRLRQVDTDGTSAFSPVVAVQVRSEVAVYPNPSAGSVTLPAMAGTVRYRVLNTIGQTVLSGQAAGNDQLDLTTLAKGTFFLELTGENGRTTQRLVRE